MGLKEMYLSANADSYAGRARERQAGVNTSGGDADAGLTNGVNYLDGEGRSPAHFGNVAPDQFQTEFTRRPSGAFRNGDIAVPGTDTADVATDTEQIGLTRWYGRALNIAFKDAAGTSKISQYNKLGKSPTGVGKYFQKYAPGFANIPTAKPYSDSLSVSTFTFQGVTFGQSAQSRVLNSNYGSAIGNTV